MKKLQRILSLLLSFVLIFGSISSLTTVDAISKKTKNKAYKAYRNWLYETDCSGIRLYDVNKDGLKELLVTYDGYGTGISSFKMYTYKGGKVISCLEDFIYEEYIPGGLYYNKSTKRLHGKRGGGGGIEDWYYTLDKSKSIKRVYLQKVETQFNSATGKFKYGYYYKGKTISKKTYSKKLKSWNKNLKPLKFYKLTERNIKKHIK